MTKYEVWRDHCEIAVNYKRSENLYWSPEEVCREHDVSKRNEMEMTYSSSGFSDAETKFDWYSEKNQIVYWTDMGDGKFLYFPELYFFLEVEYGEFGELLTANLLEKSAPSIEP